MTCVVKLDSEVVGVSGVRVGGKIDSACVGWYTAEKKGKRGISHDGLYTD